MILTSLNFKNLKKLQFHILSEILISLNFKNLKKFQFHVLLNEIFIILISLNFKNLKKLQFHVLNKIFVILTSLNFKNLKKEYDYKLSLGSQKRIKLDTKKGQEDALNVHSSFIKLVSSVLLLLSL